jgi:hypothetical protein
MLKSHFSAPANFSGCVPKIVLDVTIAPQNRLLPAVRRLPSPKTLIAQAFDRDQHNLQDTTNFSQMTRGARVDGRESPSLAPPARAVVQK